VFGLRGSEVDLMSWAQKTLVVVVVYSVFLMVFAAASPVKAQGTGTGGLQCSFVMNQYDPFSVTLINIHALVGDINSPAAGGGTMVFEIDWGDGKPHTTATVGWHAGAFGASVPSQSHTYDTFPRSYNLVLNGRHSAGPTCRFTSQAQIAGGGFLAPIAGIIVGAAAVVATNPKPVPNRPTWWKPLRPGVPYFMTNRITSLLDMPKPLRELNPYKHHNELRRWPTFQMKPGTPSDPWKDIKCPYCGSQHMFYSAWGVGCHNPTCMNNFEEPPFPHK
jgi:hypothetical protein